MTRILVAALALSGGLAIAPFAAAQDTAMPPAPPSQMPPPAQAEPGEPGVTASQPVANPPDSKRDVNADSGYRGDAYGQAFRDIDGRLADLSSKAGSNRKAMAELKAIKGDELVRRKRNGGELRDFDREVLNKKLDAVQAMMGAG
jgi:hypothetical protein